MIQHLSRRPQGEFIPGDVWRLGIRTALANPTRTSVVAAHDSASSRADSAVAEVNSELRRLKAIDPRIRYAACRSGCAHCCYGRVSVLPIEAVRIALHIEANPTQTWDLASHREALHGLDPVAQANASVPCPFLTDAQTCGIYTVRPLACRMHHSADADRCRQSLTDPAVKVPQIPAYGDAVMPIVTALHQVSKEAGLSSYDLPLVAAVEHALTPGVIDCWLSRNDAFQPVEDQAFRGAASQRELPQHRGLG